MLKGACLKFFPLYTLSKKGNLSTLYKFNHLFSVFSYTALLILSIYYKICINKDI